MFQDKDDIFGNAMIAGDVERQEADDLPSRSTALRLLELKLESLNRAGNPVMRPVSWQPGNIAAGFTILIDDVGFVRWLGGTRFEVMTVREKPMQVQYDLTPSIHGGDMRRFLLALADDPMRVCAAVAADAPTFSFLSPHLPGDLMPKAASFLVPATGLVGGMSEGRYFYARPEIENIIDDAHDGNSAFSFTSGDLIRIASLAESNMDAHDLAEDDRPGTVIVASAATQKCGDGPDTFGTIARLQRRNDGWHLVEFERKTLRNGMFEIVYMPFSRAPMAARQRELVA